jgi:hypothetical protein
MRIMILNMKTFRVKYLSTIYMYPIYFLLLKYQILILSFSTTSNPYDIWYMVKNLTVRNGVQFKKSALCMQ